MPIFKNNFKQSVFWDIGRIQARGVIYGIQG